MAHVVIIGAGLAGLSAAFHLEGEDYIILEKDKRPGGLCRSDELEGFTFDRAIHVLYTKDAYAEHFIKEVLLQDNLLIHKRESWIFSHGAYTEYPFQANTYGNLGISLNGYMQPLAGE